MLEIENLSHARASLIQKTQAGDRVQTAFTARGPGSGGTPFDTPPGFLQPARTIRGQEKIQGNASTSTRPHPGGGKPPLPPHNTHGNARKPPATTRPGHRLTVNPP